MFKGLNQPQEASPAADKANDHHHSSSNNNASSSSSRSSSSDSSSDPEAEDSRGNIKDNNSNNSNSNSNSNLGSRSSTTKSKKRDSQKHRFRPRRSHGADSAASGQTARTSGQSTPMPATRTPKSEAGGERTPGGRVRREPRLLTLQRLEKQQELFLEKQRQLEQQQQQHIIAKLNDFESGPTSPPCDSVPPLGLSGLALGPAQEQEVLERERKREREREQQQQQLLQQQQEEEEEEEEERRQQQQEEKRQEEQKQQQQQQQEQQQEEQQQPSPPASLLASSEQDGAKEGRDDSENEDEDSEKPPKKKDTLLVKPRVSLQLSCFSSAHDDLPSGPGSPTTTVRNWHSESSLHSEVTSPIARNEDRRDSLDRGTIRRRTLVFLEEMKTATEEEERCKGTRSGKELWEATQKKMKAISQFQQVADNPDSIVLLEAILQMPIFQSCSLDFNKAISNCMDVYIMKSNAVIVNPGDKAPCLYWVLRGSMSLLVNGEECFTLGVGESWGASQLLRLEPRWTVGLRADSLCTVVELTRENFEACLRLFPSEGAFYENITLSLDKAAKESHEANSCSLFVGLPAYCLRALESCLLRRVLFPGECFLHEGQSGDEMYILVQGSINITLAGRLLRKDKRAEARNASGVTCLSPAQPPSFGELGLLGVQATRTASITAEGVCLVRVLHRLSFHSALKDDGQLILQRVGLMSRRYQGLNHATQQRLRDVGLFREIGCNADFIDFLEKNLEHRMFLQGQKVIDEEILDDRCMYILLDGTVSVVKKGTVVAKMGKGSVIGEVAALGLESKRSASVVAEETCYLQCLHQSIIVRGLELFPEDRHKVLGTMLQRVGGATAVDSTLSLLLSGKLVNPRRRQEFYRDVMQHTDLFKVTGQEFLNELASVSSDRLFMPGDYIVEEGKRGVSMFVMLSGEAGVFKGNVRLGTVQSGSVSGELAMLGVSLYRTASMKALQVCLMWEIPQEKAMPLLERNPVAKKHFTDIVLQHLQSTVPTLLLSLPLLYDFDSKVKTLMGLWCEKRVYFSGQYLVKESAPGSRLCILNLGRASLEKKGITIRTYDAGSHFGAHLLTGDPLYKVYLASLVALQTCHVVMISRQVYLQVLEKYPDKNAARRFELNERQAALEMSEMIRRVSSKKLVYKRYGTLLGQGSEMVGISDHEMLCKIMAAWAALTERLRAMRVQRECRAARTKETMDKWLLQKVEARAKVVARRRALWRSSEGDEDDQPSKPSLPPSPSNVGRWARAASVYEGGVQTTPRSIVPSPKSRGAILSRGLDSWDSEHTEDEEEDAGTSPWPTPKQSPFYDLKCWDYMPKPKASPRLILQSQSESSSLTLVTCDNQHKGPLAPRPATVGCCTTSTKPLSPALATDAAAGAAGIAAGAGGTAAAAAAEAEEAEAAPLAATPPSTAPGSARPQPGTALRPIASARLGGPEGEVRTSEKRVGPATGAGGEQNRSDERRASLSERGSSLLEVQARRPSTSQQAPSSARRQSDVGGDARMQERRNSLTVARRASLSERRPSKMGALGGANPNLTNGSKERAAGSKSPQRVQLPALPASAVHEAILRAPPSRPGPPKCEPSTGSLRARLRAQMLCEMFGSEAQQGTPSGRKT